MTTTQALIHDVTRHLLSAEREEQNKLNGTVTAGATTITCEFDLGGIQPGATLSVDLEMMHVWSVNDASLTATVERGQFGTTAATHTDNTIVYVNPRFPWFQIVDIANAEIEDLSSPTYGLYSVATVDLTASSVALTYDLSTTRLLDILDVRWDAQGSENAWPQIRKWDLFRNAPTGEFASGTAIRFHETVTPGRTIRVKYKQHFTGALTALADTIVTVTGVPVVMQDIVALGVAARLMTVRDAKRSFTESQSDSRRAGEVQTGDATRAAVPIWQMRANRIRAEAARLDAQYGNRSF